MAQLPVEIMNLLSDGSAGLTLALAEAARVQQEFDFTLLDSTYADAMRLHVRRDTHSGTFFDALSTKKREWRGYHPFIVAFLDCALHSDKWGNLFSSRCAENGLAIVTHAGVTELIVPADEDGRVLPVRTGGPYACIHRPSGRTRAAAQGVVPEHLVDAASARHLSDLAGHPERDDYWRVAVAARGVSTHRDPVFNTAGWFDVFIGGSLANHTGMTTVGGGGRRRAAARGSWWARGATASRSPPILPVARRSASTPRHPASSSSSSSFAFFDRWLRGRIERRPPELDPPVRLFVMGEDRWRAEEAWPLARAVATDSTCVRAGQPTARVAMAGCDLAAPASGEPADTFVADPRDPVPTVGGNLCCWQIVMNPGSFDQRAIEARDGRARLLDRAPGRATSR